MINLTEVKTALNINPSNASHDTFLTDMISHIKASIKSYCGQNIEQCEVLYYFIGDETKYQLIKQSPLVSITSLKYRELPTDSWTTIDSSEYAVVENDGLKYLFYSGYYTAKFYELTYQSGFETVPADVKNVALEMAVWHWSESNRSDDKSLVIASKSISEAGKTVNFSYMKDWKKDWFRVLGAYRNYFV